MVAPLGLAGLVGVSCATQTTIVGSGGSGGSGGGPASSVSSTGKSASTSATSSSSGAGGCVMAADCTAMNDACNVGTCVNGTCIKGPANESGSCDDGLFCTDNDSCKSGVCVGGTPKSCNTMDACHIGTCDEATDTCMLTPGNDGALCDDMDLCTLSGVCMGGVCSKGQPVDCSVLDSTCALGMCVAGQGCQAVPKNDGAPCDDGLFCTSGDVCTAGKCGGVPNICAPPNSPCLVGSCNEVQKKCTNVPAPNGTVCDDMSTCTSGTTCTNGVCGGGQPANQGGACNDGKACTNNDVCSNGVCNGSTIVACANNDGCCPPGCSLAVDNDCNCNVNLALTATGVMSAGGSAQYGPTQLNNGIGASSCGTFAWISNNVNPSGAYFEYDWGQPVTIGSFYVETTPGLMAGPCGNPLGRNLASGTVQYWNGASWVTSTTWSGQHSDLKIDLPQPVTTTKLRLYDVTTDPGNGNSLIYEWHVYTGTGCMPPP